MKIQWKLNTFDDGDWELLANNYAYVLVNNNTLTPEELQDVYRPTTLKTFIQRLYKLERL